MGWTGMDWGGMGWNGVEWGGMGWNGMGWDGMGWTGVDWGGMGWNEMGWNGMEWNEMECSRRRDVLCDVAQPARVQLRPRAADEGQLLDERLGDRDLMAHRDV